MHGRAVTLGEPLLTTARARLATSLAWLALAAGPPAAVGQAPPTVGRRFAAIVLVCPPLPKPVVSARLKKKKEPRANRSFFLGLDAKL
jgi:hypothetical protein